MPVSTTTTDSARSVAIVGIGCRLPGGISCPLEFIEALEKQHDGVSEVPAERFTVERFVDDDSSTPGRAYTNLAGFLKQSPFEFDPTPFGISPREAELLDPQQRLLLEVTYEALEDAGISLQSIAGTRTAVVVGGFTLDHLLRAGNANSFAHTGTHTAFTVTMTTLSARIAHTFDLHGPCFTVDTACSASLVALHVAYKQIMNGECDRAIVAGVNVITDPYFSVMLSKGKFLSRNGRSKAFDASADGYGRGEGAGVVILESLDVALARPNHYIHALVRGTAVNHGGHTTGMALPCEKAQKRLITEACESSGVDPKKITYVEAHGTGTLAGDPVEARALGAVYGSAHAGKTPVIIGSVKTNIGHLEAASGITGLIKATLSVREAKIFPQRLFTKLNPTIPFDDLNLRVALKAEEWPASDDERMAAVNSFGYGGTNAHAIVAEAPKEPAKEQPTPHATQILVFSAFDAPALRERALQLGPYASALPLATLSAALARRPGLPHRAAIVAGSQSELEATLDSIVSINRSMVSLPLADAIVGKVVSNSAKFAWIFTGMGPQWVDMGRELLAEDAVFRQACERVDTYFKEASEGAWSCLDEFNSPALPSRIGRNDVAQPLNLMLQVGLTEVLRSRGSKPDIIIGHSVGEVAAAWASGCLSLKDAVTLSWHRSQLQQQVAGGGMLAVALGEAEVTKLIGGYADVHIAAVNASNSVTLAGDIKQLTEIGDNLTKQNIFARKLLVEVAYHSAHMEPIKEKFMAALAHLKPSAPTIPLISTVTGTFVTSPIHSAGYWWKNSRYAVYLMRATQTALDAGVRIVLEVGPHPVLAPAMKTTAGSTKIVTSACLKRKEPELRTLLRALASLWCSGAPLDLPTHTDKHIDLPPYPWQRQRLWSESAVSVKRRTQPGVHALLDLQQEVPHTEWHTQLAGNHLKFMLDHVVDEQPILPGAAFIDAGLAAARNNGAKSNTSVALLDIKLLRALRLNPDTTFSVSIINNNEVKMHARRGDDAWNLHASATLGTEKYKYGKIREISEPPADAQKLSTLVLYNKLRARGNNFGPLFRVLTEVYHSPSKTEAWARMETALPTSNWVLHPVLLDATFQTALSLMMSSEDRPILPTTIERIQVVKATPVGNSLRTHVVLRSALCADIVLADTEGIVAEVKGLQCVQLASAHSVDSQWLYNETWTPVTLEGKNSEPLDLWRAPNSSDAVALLASLRQKLNENNKPLVVVTQSARAVESQEKVDPVHRALWGLIRTARTEYNSRLLALVDLPPAPTPEDEAILVSLSSEDIVNYGDELAIRAGRLLGAHIARTSISAPAPAAHQRQNAFELVQDAPGQLSALAYKGVSRRIPAKGEVEVEVRAIGLNFKDLMKVMGMLSFTATENTFTGRTIGLECAGVVTAVSPDSAYKVGDSVFSGMVRNGFGSHAILNDHFVKHVPSSMNFEQAASLFAYVTAWYGLVTAANLAEGEHVLVHSATGGVGLAAVYIALLRGAIVHATAGSEEKRAWLLTQGVTSVHDSRTLNFADEIRAATNGYGVDVVLNSLAGPALEASVNVLAAGGRFVELGKQDIASNSKLSLLAFNRCLSFTAVDLDRLAAFKPTWYSGVVDAVLEACTRTDSPLPPLPLTTFDSSKVEEAFRFMAAAKHIGKIVLKFDPENPPQVTPRNTVCANRSYLVTGGVHGLGLSFASNLVSLGAKHLWLVGRRGTVGEDEQKVIDDMRANKVTVHVVACDVSIEAEVEKLVAGIQPPLAGVFHAAAYMADEALETQPAEEFAKVVRVKANGSLALHNATKHMDLHYFAMFSSIFSLLGNPKQGAYAAANSFMDGLAELRRSEGKPGLAIAFGPISGVGMVNSAISKHLASLGVKSIPFQRALAALESSVINQVSGCIGLFDINWERWIKMVPTQSWARLIELREKKAAGSETNTAANPAALAAAIAKAVTKVMRLTPVHTTPLRDYGLDSIVAVELAAAIEAEAGIATSSIELISGVSVASLVQRAVNDAAKQAAAAEGPKEGPKQDEQIIEVLPDLRQWILDNICVQQPYFDLETVEEDKETKVLRTTVSSGAHCPHEQGKVSSAEVARNLAILGSGAARRNIGDKVKGRIYFPVEDAWLIENLMPNEEWIKDEKYRIVAKCTGVDRMSSKAYAEASLFTLDEKTLLATWGFAYHVIPAKEYEQIFAKHAQPTIPHTPGLQPYNRWVVLDTESNANGEVKSELEVKAEYCQGHFVGFPAFPISIMMRHCINMVGIGVGSKVQVVDFVVEAKRFAWAGEKLTLIAAPDEDDRTSWCVQATVGAEVIGLFKLKIHYVRNAKTFWSLVRRNVTGKVAPDFALGALVDKLKSVSQNEIEAEVEEK